MTADGARGEAIRRFEEFTGHAIQRVSRVKSDKPFQTGYKLGRVVGVAYQAKRDGRTDRYFHEFSKPSAPDLLVSSDGSRIAINGGKYRVTNHGIEDR